MEREIRGLENLGTTCYINAVLQMLLNCDPFMNDISRYHEDRICMCLIELKRMSKNSYDRQRPVLMELTRFLKKYDIIEGGAGDSFLFFNRLFVYFSKKGMEIPSFLSMYREKKKNCLCRIKKNITKKCHSIKLEVTRSVQCTLPTIQKRNAREFRCKTCSQEIEKSEEIFLTPQCLLLCLDCVSESVKHRVIIEEKLYYECESIIDIYRLNSVVIHTGGYHYFTCVRKDDRFFYKCDDDDITIVSSKSVFNELDRTGYYNQGIEKRKKLLILLYEKISTTPNRGIVNVSLEEEEELDLPKKEEDRTTSKRSFSAFSRYGYDYEYVEKDF